MPPVLPISSLRIFSVTPSCKFAWSRKRPSHKFYVQSHLIHPMKRLLLEIPWRPAASLPVLGNRKRAIIQILWTISFAWTSSEKVSTSNSYLISKVAHQCEQHECVWSEHHAGITLLLRTSDQDIHSCTASKQVTAAQLFTSIDHWRARKSVAYSCVKGKLITNRTENWRKMFTHWTRSFGRDFPA